jgi:hypothetical protein
MKRTCRSFVSATLAILAAALSAATSTAAPQRQPVPIGAPPPPAAATADAFVLGQVVDGSTNRPVSGAQVSMTSAGRPPTPVLTNANGQFVFRGLEAGKYSFRVGARGYMPGGYGAASPGSSGRLLAIEAHARITDTVIRLWKFGAISGRVIDESGDPVTGAMVNAVRRNLVAGRPRLTATSRAQTDDRGVYRFGSVVPGEYLIVVPATSTTLPASVVSSLETGYRAIAQTGSNVGASALMRSLSAAGVVSGSLDGVRTGEWQVVSGVLGTTASPVVEDAGRLLAYPTVMHPSALAPDAAAFIRVDPGEEHAGADVRLELVPTARVSGRVAGPDGPVGGLVLKLVAPGASLGNESLFVTAAAVSASDGRFMFAAVPRGSYVMQARTTPPAGPRTSAGVPAPAPDMPTLWADVPVTLGARDVTGLTVTLRPGARVSGRIEFHGAAVPPADAAGLMVMLSSNDNSGPFPAPVGLLADRRFRTQQYAPGRYDLNVQRLPRGWTLSSIVVGGRDVTDKPIELAAEDIDDVVVTLTQHPPSLSGAVQPAPGSRSREATVVILPADYRSWIANGMSPRRARTAASATDGTFTIGGMLPGDYLVAAVDPQHAVTLQDPDEVAALAGVATRVALHDAEQRTVSLTVARLP